MEGYFTVYNFYHIFWMSRFQKVPIFFQPLEIMKRKKKLQLVDKPSYFNSSAGTSLATLPKKQTN